MTLFIQTDTGGAGAGSVFPDRAGLDLIAISNNDPGYGEAAPVANQIQVTYNRTTTGPCPERLDTLVNTDFPTTVGTVDIVVIAADTMFTLNDGTLLVGGVAIPPNLVANMINYNPSDSAVVIYDTSDNAGTGICVQEEGTGTMALGSPSSVILYHELSHAFRMATTGVLDQTETDCADASDEEAAAIVDENDMRDQLGIAHRQPDNHCASVGCTAPSSGGTCCIVASVASGSPYSAEVRSLRQLRDSFLRKSEVGYDFFEHLHTDYYRFSPEVVNLMGSAPTVRSMVEAYFVRPLVEALDLLRAHTIEGCPPDELGARFRTRVAAWPEVAALPEVVIRELRTMLDGAAGRPVPRLGWVDPERLEMLSELLQRQALPSPYVKWALADVISLLLEALEARAGGATSDELGALLAERMNAWAAAMPIGEVWRTLSRHEIGEELEFMRAGLLRAPSAQRVFARRLAAAFPDEPRIREALAAHGLLDQEVAS